MNIKRKLRDIDYLPKGLREYIENDLADMLEIFNETALTGVNSPVTGPVSIEELGFYLRNVHEITSGFKSMQLQA
ncbi:MAG: hypothetical protein P8Y42_17145 [Exilibacterium sp.]